jgi:phenylacetate-CoA ligase
MVAQFLGQVIVIEPYEILSEDNLSEYVRQINRHKPDVINAFAGTIYEIAKYAKRKGTPMYRPRFIVTSVEMLYPAMRETLEDVFRSPVRNMYGAAEVGRVACTCSEGNWHVLINHNHVEILNPDDTPTAPGQMGRIVVTSLHNHAMPFIRYDIGDLARVSTEPCSCGSPLPTLDEICGRVIHHFVRADGTLVFGGNFIAMFYEHEWMMKFHVLQEDVDRITISYQQLPGSKIPEGATEALTQTVQDVMGSDCRVAWNEVDVIPNSPIGKHLHCRSLVWEQRVQSGKR